MLLVPLELKTSLPPAAELGDHGCNAEPAAGAANATCSLAITACRGKRIRPVVHLSVRPRYVAFDPFRVEVPTDCFYSEGSAESDSVHVRVVLLAETLPVDADSGRYVAPADFGEQMAAVRGCLHLALGRRAAEFPYLLQVRGYKMLLACPIRSVEHVMVQPEAEPR